MKKFLITGSTGFVGRRLYENLKLKNYYVREAVRSINDNTNRKFEKIEIGQIDKHTDWSTALKDIDCVIHCAGRAHKLEENTKDSQKLYNEVNEEGTANLAKQSIKQGVKKFIFISTIKVNGEKTKKNFPFKFDDDPKPTDFYSTSKWKAEKILINLSKNYSMDIVIIRSPLVYGPNVKGNFLRLMNLAYKKIPLPISNFQNLRSFVYLDNLIDLIFCCIKNPSASGKTFLVSDGDDLSTRELINMIGKEMNKNQYFFYLPIFLIKFFSKILKKTSEVERIMGNLQVDINYTCKILNWKPPVKINEGLNKTVKWYLENR